MSGRFYLHIFWHVHAHKADILHETILRQCLFILNLSHLLFSINREKSTEADFILIRDWRVHGHKCIVGDWLFWLRMFEYHEHELAIILNCWNEYLLLACFFVFSVENTTSRRITFWFKANLWIFIDVFPNIIYLFKN